MMTSSIFIFHSPTYLESVCSVLLFCCIQVHEKSILLVAVPMACLYPFQGFWSITFLHLSVFSLYPLMIKDDLVIPYYVLLIAYHIICVYILPAFQQRTNEEEEEEGSTLANIIRFQSILIIGMLFVSLLALIMEPPKSLPYFWPSMISLIASLGFMLYAVIGNVMQLYGNCI